MPDGSRFSVEDPRFREERRSPAPATHPQEKSQPEKVSRGPFSTCLFGCFITLLILVAVGAVGAWWIANNWRDFASALGSEAVKTAIDATDLAEVEKREIASHIDRLAVDFREGRLTGDQLRAIFENIKQSPLMTTLVASAIERKYIAGSQLSDAEKEKGVQTVRRFLRGLVERRLSDESVDNAMQHVALRNKEGDWELRDQVTDEELKQFFAAANAAADAANIPPEANQFDPSDEFKRIVDEATQRP